MERWSPVFRSRELFKRLSGLSPVAIELYRYVAKHCDLRNVRYVATSAEVANALSITVRSVQRANNELEAADLLRFKRGIYAVNPEFNWGAGIFQSPVINQWGKSLRLSTLPRQHRP